MPAFDDSEAIRRDIDQMTGYLWRLIEEHAEHKQLLSEMQRTAEKLDGEERQHLLDGIWAQLRSMRYLKDFIDGGRRYGQYRQDYFHALTLMRESLASQGDRT